MKLGISADFAKSLFGSDKVTEWIEKSKKGEQKSDHKYIWRTPKETGKGYDYIYEEDQIKNPFDMLLKFFKIGKATVTKLYKEHNIEADYKATENQFASHVLEYEAKKDKWDKFFSNVDKNKVTKNPKTMAQSKEIEKKNAEKKGKEAVKNLESKKFVPNKTLMRKIWAIRNPEKAKEMDIAIANMDAEKAKEIAGDSIPLHFNKYNELENVKIGDKLTLGSDKTVYEVTNVKSDGFVELKSSKGTVFGKLKDNAVTEETPVESNETAVEESTEKTGYTEGEKAAIALAYKKEKDFDPTLSDYAYYEKIKAKMPDLDAKGELYSTMLNVKDMMLSDSQLNAAKEYLEGKVNDSLKRNINLAENESNRRSVLNEYYDSIVQNDFETFVADEKIKLDAEISHKRDKIKYLKSLDSKLETKEEVVDIAQNLEILKLTKKWETGMTDSEIENHIKNIALSAIKENARKEAIKRSLSEAMMGNDNAKGKHNVKPKTNKENKEEKKKENESRRKAGLSVPKEELGERSSAIEDVDVQNHEFTEAEESTREELKTEVKVPSNQAQKDAFNELAAAKYELDKKSYGMSFYGKMNHKFASTDEEVAEAQKRYDEALAKYNSLIGADNTDFSYNPNAENYAYRDTGYIAGSQKEKIAQFWADVAERGGGVKLEDIDWVALEENLRYAESKIIKANILKKPDFEALRESGMSGGAAYFYNRLIDAIPTKPAENTPDGHRNYVLAVNTFQERMEKCKTVKEMVKEMTDIADEMAGRFIGADKTPEVAAIQSQIESLKDDEKAERNQFGHYEVELWKIPLVKEFTKNNNDFIKRAYGKPYPFALGRSDSLDDKLASNFISFWTNNDKWYSFIKDNEKELMKYPDFKAYKEMLDKAEIIDMRSYYQNKHIQLPIAKQIKALEKQKKDIIQKINDEYMFNSSEHKMWAAFGPAVAGTKVKNRFYEYMQSADDFNSYFYRGNKTILGHYENAMRGKFDDWEWLPKKEENSVSGEKKERKESFQLLVATEHERKGGKDVSVKTTQELKEMFNLRDIQSGEWVLKDPKSAKWHVDRCCEGFADLCDVTGIPENLISLNGRLALAIGARGHKGALAHYEPVERVINITKMHGGGSLAHEWFHAFDNMLSEAMLGGNIDAWLTKPGKGHKDAPDNIIPEVKQAFTKLVDAMKKGDNPVMKSVKVTDTDKKNPDRVLRSVLYYRNYGADTQNIYSDVMKSTSFEEANNVLMSKWKSFVTGWGGISSGRVKLFQQAQRAIAAKFGRNSVDVFTGDTASNFFIAAWNLDGSGKKSYWSTTHEMAARAFSGFIGDNLRKAGRINTYLTSHDTNEAYPSWAKPNPEGEERERINAAFMELFNAVNATNAIRKAIAVLDGDVFIPQVITNGRRFMIRKSILKKMIVKGERV